jgi:hypothetical protein
LRNTRENVIVSADNFWVLIASSVKFVCGNEIGEILYGTHEYCNICDASSREFTGTYLRSNSSSNNRGKKKEHVGYGSVL